MIVAAQSLSCPKSFLGHHRAPRRRGGRICFTCAGAAAAAVAPPRAANSNSRPATLYGVLGVPPSATACEIKAAYRRLARERHPDVARDKGDAEEEFIRIHAAYATLSDPSKRAEYDRDVMPQQTGGRRPACSDGSPSPTFRQSPSRKWETDQCW